MGKITTVMIMAGLACLCVLAAGCTGTSSGTANTTTTPTVAATAAPHQPWNGTWHHTWTENGQEFPIILYIQQTGTSVAGWADGGNDTFQGTVTGNQMIGNSTYVVEYASSFYYFKATLSSDENSYTGKWAYSQEGVENSTETWLGIRI